MPLPSGVTFAVDNVLPAEKPVWTETLAVSLKRRLQREIVVLPDADLVVTNSKADETLTVRDRWRAKHAGESLPSLFFSRSDEELVRDAGSRHHPLIDAVHTAFAQHRPLTLSPDDVWLLIAQGFSHHVIENAEALRPRLVRHQGSRELVAEVSSLDAVGFKKAIESFSKQIREETDPVLHATLICDFSTTTPGSLVASQIALMDTYSTYFTYTIGCVCGIPKIRIEGSTEDWNRIRDRVEVLATYGLEWWISRLRPILDEFVLASAGRPTHEFWKAIYKPEDAYATTLATGWIADFFPYLGDAPSRSRNPALTIDRVGWALPAHRGISLKRFPGGLSAVPVKVKLKRQQFHLELVGGFLAVKQGLADLALSTVIGWSVAEASTKTPVVLG